MRNRYRRYEAGATDWLRETFRGASPSAVFMDEAQRYTPGEQAEAGSQYVSERYARKRLEVSKPRISGETAAEDLTDVVTDLRDRLDALTEAGLGSVVATLEELHDELHEVAGYAQNLLRGHDTLYKIADGLTGDLDAAQRDLRGQAGRLAEAETELVTLRQAATERLRLIQVLEEAEARGTIGRGTTARWVKAAHERA